MVLIMGQNPTGNILHVVTGPESDAAMAVNGVVVLDITPALKQFDTERPVILHMTRCNSEQKLVGDLQLSLTAGATYPFFPPMIVFGPKAAVEAITPNTGMQKMQKAGAEPVMGECSICKGKNIELVPKLEPKICYNCVKIELGLRKNAKKKSGEPNA